MNLLPLTPISQGAEVGTTVTCEHQPGDLLEDLFPRTAEFLLTFTNVCFSKEKF